MEASSTTINIAGPAPEPEAEKPPFEMPTTRPKRHDHGPNFGRYVKDCGACEWSRAFGPKPRPSRAVKNPPPGPVPSSLLTKDEIIALLRQAAPEMLQEAAASIPTPEAPPVPVSNDQLAQLIQLMLGKEAKAIAKENEDEKKKLLAREDMIRVCKEAEAVVKATQDACGHVKENGRSRIAQSQVHNDGFVHPFCMGCGKTFPKFRPQQEQMSTSVNG